MIRGSAASNSAKFSSHPSSRATRMNSADCSGSALAALYRPYEMVTDAGSQGKLVSERNRPGSARSAFQAAQAASTTAS